PAPARPAPSTALAPTRSSCVPAPGPSDPRSPARRGCTGTTRPGRRGSAGFSLLHRVLTEARELAPDLYEPVEHVRVLVPEPGPILRPEEPVVRVRVVAGQLEDGEVQLRPELHDLLRRQRVLHVGGVHALRQLGQPVPLRDRHGLHQDLDPVTPLGHGDQLPAAVVCVPDVVLETHGLLLCGSGTQPRSVTLAARETVFAVVAAVLTADGTIPGWSEE